MNTSSGPGTVLRVAPPVSPRQPVCYSSGIIPLLSDDGPETQGWCPAKVAQHGSSNKILASLLCFFFQTIQKTNKKKTPPATYNKVHKSEGYSLMDTRTHVYDCCLVCDSERGAATHSPLCCASLHRRQPLTSLTFSTTVSS